MLKPKSKTWSRCWFILLLYFLVPFFFKPSLVVKSIGDSVVINEFLIAPHALYSQEWVELYNTNTSVINLKNWQIDDMEGGSTPVTIATSDDFLAPQALKVIYLSKSMFNNTGYDAVRIRDDEGQVIDEKSFDNTTAPYDISSGRCPDGGEDWQFFSDPSPGQTNHCSGYSTPTGTIETFTPTISSTHTPTLMETVVVFTPTKTVTRTETPITDCFDVVINEFLPAPHEAYIEEWIELYNEEDFAVNLQGWKIDDLEDGGSGVYTIEEEIVIDEQDWAVLYYHDSKISLNNNGDTVRLICPRGEEADSFEYKETTYDFSWQRYPDGSHHWYESDDPSPGEENHHALIESDTNTPTKTRTPTKKPTILYTSSPTKSPTPVIDVQSIFLSEMLPAPGSRIDWDGDGKADSNDEWIELYNDSLARIDLSLWQLDDGIEGSNPYTIPEGTTIGAHTYVVFYKDETRLALNNTGDVVRLFDPTGFLVDSFTYESTQTDYAYVKTNGIWYQTTTPTPGEPASDNLVSTGFTTSTLLSALIWLALFLGAKRLIHFVYMR